MKRREIRERDEAAARDQAEQRTEALLARLKARETAARQPTAGNADDVMPDRDTSEADEMAETADTVETVENAKPDSEPA